MASSSSNNASVPLAANVNVLPTKNNQAHAPESSLDAEKAKIWQSQESRLIPYSI